MSACNNTSVDGEKTEILLAHHSVFHICLATDFSCLGINLPYLWFGFPCLLFSLIQQLERENSSGTALMYFH